jgi:hypothetical protein
VSATITIAQHTGSDTLGGTAQNPTITYASAQTAKNLNAIIIVWDNTQPLLGVVDSSANVYKRLGLSTPSGGALALYRCLSIAAAGAGNVVTMNFAAAPTAGPEAWIIEAHTTNGSWSDGPFDSGTAASGTAMSTSGVTLASQPALGFAAASSGSGSTVTQGTNWNALDPLAGSDMDQWIQINSAGRFVATMSQLVSANWDLVAGYFYVTGGVRAKLLPLGI